jgi:hypothetical protein
MRRQHGLIPTVRLQPFAGLLGFQNEVLAIVEIDIAPGHAAVRAANFHPVLENIGVMLEE